MIKRQGVEALDNSLRDIMDRPELPFGGRPWCSVEISDRFFSLFRRGSRAQVVGASLRMSYLWDSMWHLKLVRNMRTKSDLWFA